MRSGNQQPWHIFYLLKQKDKAQWKISWVFIPRLIILRGDKKILTTDLLNNVSSWWRPTQRQNNKKVLIYSLNVLVTLFCSCPISFFSRHQSLTPLLLYPFTGFWPRVNNENLVKSTSQWDDIQVGLWGMSLTSWSSLFIFVLLISCCFLQDGGFQQSQIFLCESKQLFERNHTEASSLIAVNWRVTVDNTKVVSLSCCGCVRNSISSIQLWHTANRLFPDYPKRLNRTHRLAAFLKYW